MVYNPSYQWPRVPRAGPDGDGDRFPRALNHHRHPSACASMFMSAWNATRSICFLCFSERTQDGLYIIDDRKINTFRKMWRRLWNIRKHFQLQSARLAHLWPPGSKCWTVIKCQRDEVTFVCRNIHSVNCFYELYSSGLQKKRWL